jgi:hypothetical protein
MRFFASIAFAFVGASPDTQAGAQVELGFPEFAKVIEDEFALDKKLTASMGIVPQ